MSSMKFLSALQNPYPVQSSPQLSHENLPSEEGGIQSVLHPENREWLAKQGYYNQHNEKQSPNEKSAPTSKNSSKLQKSLSLDASERRKMFQKSRTPQPQSLCDLIESDETVLPVIAKDAFKSLDSHIDSDNASCPQSFDNGFHMGNFTSMETSTDSFDSVDSGKGYFSQKSGKSRDTFYDYGSISNRRKEEVEMLMSGKDDDGQYHVSPASSRQSSLEHTLTSHQLGHKLQKQKESQSTLTADDEEADSLLQVTNESSQLLDSSNEKRVKFQHEDETDSGHASPGKTSDKSDGGNGKVLTLYFPKDKYSEGDVVPQSVHKLDRLHVPGSEKVRYIYISGTVRVLLDKVLYIADG